MNVANVAAQIFPPDMRTAQEANGQSIIDLQAIKSILYLGVKGKIQLNGPERHRVDTFA
jgi:hypothetical protein